MTELLQTLITVNGRPTSSVSALDRGLAFGDGVFETICVRAGHLPLWQYHKARLLDGCQRLYIPLDVVSMQNWVQALLQQAFSGEYGAQAIPDCAVLKVVVSRGVGGRGYAIDSSLEPTVVCSLHPMSGLDADKRVDLHLCQHRLPYNPLLAGIKHLNRLDNVMLKYECQQLGVEDGLVLDIHDHVIEAVSSNVFFQQGETLYTPTIASSGVSGVMRRFLLEEILPELGISCQVKEISLTDLAEYSQGFICNSVHGVTEIGSVEGRGFSSSEQFVRIRKALGGSRFYTP